MLASASLVKTVFQLMFPVIASGDLRNVVRTINELPDNYSGHVTIVLNDRQPMIVARNLLILTILGTISDNAEAADVALHFWYSAFVPQSHAVVLGRMVMRLGEHINHSPFAMKLGESSLVTGSISAFTNACLLNTYQSNITVEGATNEINRIRFVDNFSSGQSLINFCKV